ncbi:succinate dehydrogenase, cytochrome b556 subunit [Mesorhizobium qingshengii]|uniref:Succinate dehydrogenase cytochrome b556 subunit n=1 Tax=Mesorhizobium qingshengii TaxID=1165689 RepID=A0ABT4R3X2_9HYPH|nr:succinate dehydrogenase, cytochrome b556 subunit [Mesorhizobium qingshengii]MCZ8548334.1 succinate dehydrogenase, cytochrome b556 subunit [Mesorhizobium qingshengii]
MNSPTRHTRPLSPNIQIYRPQLTSVLSIANRVTGIVLSAFAVFLVIWLSVAAASPQAFATVQSVMGSWIGQLLMIAGVFSFFMHLSGGIRHLFWDAGYGFQLRTIYASGWAVVIASLLLTGATWVLSIYMAG